MTDKIENRVYSFRDGMPTGPDVAALEKRWKDIAIGDSVPYEEVEKEIGAEWRSERFRTVTTAWRARIIERGLVLICEPGRAFVVATGEQISAMTHGVLSHIGRQSKAQRKRLSTVRPESEIEKQTVEHHGRLMLMIERESKKARLNILPNSQPDEPVRISPPEKATA